MFDSPWLIFALAGVVVTLFLVLGNVWERRRTAALRETADALNFTFHGDAAEGLAARLAGFELFSTGRARQLKNRMSANTASAEVHLFDYRYTTGSGKNSSTHNQSVVAIQSPELALPRFQLRPENLFHRIGSQFGYQDIDIGGYPAFSKRYLLRGGDETSIREIFTAPVVEHFESLHGITVEGDGAWLIVYRNRRRTKPGELRERLSEALSIVAHFKEA